MDYRGLEYIRVEEMSDWVTNADLKNLAENFPLEIRGNRITKEGMLFQGDFGTQHRFYKYPLRPNAVVKITGATQASPIVISVPSTTGVVEGDIIYVNDVEGNTAANGVWVAGTVVANTSIVLTGSTGNAAYTQGGIYAETPITIVYGTTLIDSSTGYEHEIIVGIDSASDLRIFIDTSAANTGAWLELTEKMSGTINDGSIGAADTSVIISASLTENGNTIDLTDTVRYPNDYFKGWVVYNSTRTNYAYVSGYTASSRTLAFTTTIIGSGGLSWATTDVIALYRNSETFLAGFTGATGFYTYANGATPQVRILTKGSKRKATVFYGNPTTKVFGKPMQIIRRLLNTNAFNSHYGQYAGWYLRNAQLPQVAVNQIGSVGTPKNANDAAVTEYIYDGIAVTATFSETAYLTGSDVAQRILVTMQFDEQESDPIAQIFTTGYNSDRFSNVAMVFSFDMAKIPKGMTGLNLYSCTKEWKIAGVIQGAAGYRFEDDFSTYNYMGQIDINSGWASGVYTSAQATLDGVTAYWEQTTSIAFSYSYLSGVGFGNGSGSILSRLGHVPDLNRSYMTPRFAASSKETRGAFNVVDEDDNTIRRSAYSGLAVNQDDGYVDLTVDASGEKQQWELTSNGELLGLAVTDDTIIAFKRYELEFIDPQSGITRRVPADVLAKGSIVETPTGIAWCGNNGIWFLRAGSYTPELMNELWLDRYDGTSFATGSTSYITDAYRLAAIGGYNFFYDELVFFIQTNNTTAKKYVYRYSFQKKRWTVRTFELGTAMGTNVDIKYFSKRNDGTLTIGTGGGIFKYPVTTVWTDASRINQSGTAFGGNGFERFLKFNFGSIYDLLKSNYFKIFLLDKAMVSSSGTATFNIKFFANFLATAFDTKTALMDGVTKPRPVQVRGTVETLQVEISNTSSESTTQQFDITSFFAGLAKSVRIGNR